MKWMKTPELNYWEFWGAVVLAYIVIGSIVYLFYHRVEYALVIGLIGVVYPQFVAKQRATKRKQELTLQFRECLQSLSAALAAGRSLENAFRDSAKELELLYPDPHSQMRLELHTINSRVGNGVTIELALMDFSHRAQVEDIEQFIEILQISKRTGGDLVDIIRRTSLLIGEKIEMLQEMEVMIAKKRLESKLLSVTPFVIVAFLSFGSPEYMQPLYSNNGPWLMTLCLLVFIASIYMLTKLMDINRSNISVITSLQKLKKLKIWNHPKVIAYLLSISFIRQYKNEVVRHFIYLYGEVDGSEAVHPFVLKQWIVSLILLLLSCSAAWSSQSFMIFVLMFMVCAAGPYLSLRKVAHQVKQRKLSIQNDLPELISKLILLVNAGETVQRALHLCIDKKAGCDDRPLYIQLRLFQKQMKNGQSFSQALEDFSKRCAIQSVSSFTSSILIHYKRGGDKFVWTMSELSRSLWEKRKAVVRTRGEEASAKLVFPMMIIFIVVMVIVAAPAIMMIQTT